MIIRMIQDTNIDGIIFGKYLIQDFPDELAMDLINQGSAEEIDNRIYNDCPLEDLKEE